jgi:hypothetical protein
VDDDEGEDYEEDVRLNLLGVIRIIIDSIVQADGGEGYAEDSSGSGSDDATAQASAALVQVREM